MTDEQIKKLAQIIEDCTSKGCLILDDETHATDTHRVTEVICKDTLLIELERIFTVPVLLRLLGKSV